MKFVPQRIWGELGFRDLHDFNISLFTKQLWRVIQFRRPYWHVF